MTTTAPVSIQKQSVCSIRPLNLNFELYSDGTPGFKKELSQMMISNIQELQQALHDAVSQQQPDIFSKACHKTKVALYMLEDPEFTSTTEELKNLIKSHDTGCTSFSNQVAVFDALGNAVINSLELVITMDR